jgi:membrane-bound lytic murein transglycosylase D
LGDAVIRKFAVLVLVFLSFFSAEKIARAETNAPVRTPATTTNSLDAVQAWVTSNFDGVTIDFPYELDEAAIQDFLGKLAGRFQATNIYDVADLKAAAAQILPVLRQYEETDPYADWLQARIDDMDAARQMQREFSAAQPKGQAGQPLPNPSPALERSVWRRRLKFAPWPPAAKTYVPELKRVFLAERVPPALVWVAGVESSFNPKARSPAGAAGMFQLMPATARAEQLSLWPFDQRYQPEKSAHAAARELYQLHRHYGDWSLALAAYNAGAGRVDKLMREHRARSFDGINRWLPAETQMYVPKVQATIQAREGVSLEELRTPRG